MSEALFSLPSDAYAAGSDECYTPRWVFNAMGLQFDLDVAAPPGGPWHVPAKRYYTAEDDGLAQPWDGLIWCNPPYSTAQQWIERWAAHPTGCLMAQVASRQSWRSTLYAAADAVYVGQVEFARPDGSTLKFGWTPICVAFRGVGPEPAERLAKADKFGAVLYGRRITCACPPCPGRGYDGHGMKHCAECCYGIGVEADEDCPIHGSRAA